MMNKTNQNQNGPPNGGSVIDSIVAVSAAMKAALESARALANSPNPLLIYGDPGSGKNLLARAVHTLSVRRNRPIVVIRAESLHPDSLKNTLYGNLTSGRIGKLEESEEGTLVLDSLESLNPLAQEHISHVLETRRFKTAFGETRALSCRIISTADRGQLEEQTARQSFSPGLHDALTVHSIRMPALSERTADIPGLSMYILDEMAAREKIHRPTVPYHYMELLTRVPWPENARQLRNHLESVMVLSEGRFDPEIIRQHFVEEVPAETIAGVAHTVWNKLFASLGETAAATVKSK